MSRGGEEAQGDAGWVRLLLWTIIGAYLICMTWWAWSSGMEMRRQTWEYSRTVHFQTDIGNAMRWGNMVLRAGEELAHLKNEQRPLTVMEIIRGEGKVYQDLVVNNPPEGEYELDYPPIRLLVNALWSQHVEEKVPGLENWPGAYVLNYSPTSDPKELVSEDVGVPLLLMNSYAAAAAAIMAFLLVWIWTHRGGRPNLPGKKGKLVPWRAVPISKVNGMVLFLFAATPFFWAITIAESPCPPPPPSVQISQRPILARTRDGASAVITAVVDGQGGDATWHVDWGTSILYSHHTAGRAADGNEASVSLNGLPPHSVIHYRVVASGDRGVTSSDDETFNTGDAIAPMPSRYVYGAVWIDWKLWAQIAIFFVAMSRALSVMPPVHRGWAAGMIAGLFLWFDPSILVDGHIYPQWDVWLVPVFLGALLAATLDCWVIAGIVLGVGMMFKGQILVAGPVLAAWPLAAGRWGRLTRLVVGFLLTVGIIVWPWVVLGNHAIDWSVGAPRWIAAVMIAAVIAGALSFYRKPLRMRAAGLWRELRGQKAAEAINVTETVVFGVLLLAGIVLMTMLVLGRWPVEVKAPSRMWGLGLLLAVMLPPWFLRRKSMAIWLAGILGASIWTSAFLFHGDWSWKTIGFDYGTRKHTMMALGANSIGNVPRILETRFGWDVHDLAMTLHPPDVVWLRPWGLNGTPIVLDIRLLLICVFAVLLGLAGIGAAIQGRRNHPRFLAAMASVWVLMPNVLCQMAGRYQMWGAAMTCLLVGISPGLTILHIVLSLLAAGMIGGQLLLRDGSRSPQVLDLVSRLAPDDGLIALTIGLIILYLALAPGRRPTRQELNLP